MDWAGADDLATARHEMVKHQLVRRGVRDSRVLKVMETVRRDYFVPQEIRDLSYSDQALTIDCSQTISQPYIVALMSEALELTGDEAVLEIGTGSGYQAAILCELTRWVVSVERHAELSARAAAALKTLGYENCSLVVGDGTYGWAELAPYDRIIVTAAAQRMPHAVFEQLREGGILVIPIGPADAQSLQAIRKAEGQPVVRELSPCRFVPLVGSEEPRW